MYLGGQAGARADASKTPSAPAQASAKGVPPKASVKKTKQGGNLKALFSRTAQPIKPEGISKASIKKRQKKANRAAQGKVAIALTAVEPTKPGAGSKTTAKQNRSGGSSKTPKKTKTRSVATSKAPYKPSSRPITRAGGPRVHIKRDIVAPEMPSRKKARSTRSALTPGPGQLPMLAYHLIDSIESCRLALTSLCHGGARGCMQLQGVCEGRVVTVHLDWSRLGTLEGRVSLIKVSSRCHLRCAKKTN